MATDTPPQISDLLAAGANALGCADWGMARDAYGRALALEVTPDALEGFAVASWWLDDVDAAIEARERAYVRRRDAGHTIEAARVAGFLAWDYGAMRGAGAVANGWLQRARRLTAELEPSAEQAWLPLIEASFHIDTDPAAVLRLSTEAVEHALAHGALDIEMTARTLQGLALVSLGRAAEGNHLLDEGTAAATAGELHDPIAIGSCCCNMIIACERSRDYDRAGQWCERLTAFSQRTGQRPLLALCRAHHGTVLTMRGDWEQAEEHLEWAAGELSTLRPPLAGYARARLADLRRRQGRARDAREALAHAGSHTLVPLVQAGLALDEGDPSAGLGYAERYLRGLGDGQPVQRAAALELLVVIHMRLGDLDALDTAYHELAETADALATDALRAAERSAAGSVAQGRGDSRAASRAFEDATDLYARVNAPFEAAHARMALAGALMSDGRPDAALQEVLAALSAFENLGAAGAAAHAKKLVRRLGGRSVAARRAGLTDREVEVLTFVGKGLSNRQIAAELVVSDHTIHRHLANIYARLGVSSRAAAVALAAERDLLS